MKTKKWGQLEFGICNGKRPGDIGIWAGWDNAQPTEVFRVVLQFESLSSLISYTFEPSHNQPFFQSLEMPYEVRELFSGKKRASTGTILIEVLNSGSSLSKKYSLEEVRKCFFQKGPATPKSLQELRAVIAQDDNQLQNLKPQELKAHSDQIRKALEEKRLRLEAEQKAREEAQKAAAAQKAAQEAAAKAKASAATKTAGAAPEGPAIQGGRVALIYGTTTGNTGKIAEAIKQELGASVDHVKSITEITAQDLTVCEIMILGVPTWHIGEMQDDWAAFLPGVKNIDLKGKKIAIFGLGDAKGYPDTYVDAMKELWDIFEARGAKLYGLWPTATYEFKASKALKDGKFLGLVIDIENQDQMSDNRVKTWVQQLKSELSI